MNCKPGDLAVVVRSYAGNEGRIVRCVRVLSPSEADRLEYWSGPLWEVDAPLRSTQAGKVRFTNHFPDSQLSPIRPGEGEDEMLLLAGKPEGVTA